MEPGLLERLLRGLAPGLDPSHGLGSDVGSWPQLAWRLVRRGLACLLGQGQESHCSE